MKKALTLILFTCLISVLSQAQYRTSLDVKDLNSGMKDYIKTNYPEYQTTEVFRYDALFEAVIHKADTSKYLVFDVNGKFIRKKRSIDSANIGLQTRKTLAIKDVHENIPKYIASNYKGYKLFEVYQYDVVFTAKVTKGGVSETLAFDKDGNFIQKVIPPAKPAKTDSLKQPAATDPAVK